MLAYTVLEFIQLEASAKTFIFPAEENQFMESNIFNNAPVRPIAIAMNTNPALSGS